MLTGNNTNKRRPSRLPPPIPKEEVRQISTPPQLSTPPSTNAPTEFHLFWDYENVSLPSNSNPAAAGKALFKIFFSHFLSLGGIRTSPKTCSLYFSDNDSAKMTTELAQSWNLRYIPNPKKKPQIVDFAIIRDLQSVEARQNTLFIGIISGDSDFVNGASHLQDLDHHVYTVLPRNAGQALETLPCLGRFPKDVLPQHTRRLCLGNSGNAIASKAGNIVSGNAGHAASESSSVSLSNTRLLTPSKVIIKQQKKQKKKQQKKKDKQEKKDEQKKHQEEEKKKQEEQKKQNIGSSGNGKSAKVDEDRGQKSSAQRVVGAESSKKEARNAARAAASKNKKKALDKEKAQPQPQPQPQQKAQQPQNSCDESTTNDFRAETSVPVSLRINYSNYVSWKEDKNTDCLEEKEKDAEDEILLTKTGTSSFHYNNLKSW